MKDNVIVKWILKALSWGILAGIAGVIIRVVGRLIVENPDHLRPTITQRATAWFCLRDDRRGLYPRLRGGEAH